MRILVVGAGQVGSRVLRQLQKNPKLTILTVDPSETPFAVQEGIIKKVDILETMTPLTMEHILSQAHPDLVILTRTSADLGLGKVPGMDIFTDALQEELAAISEVPVIEVKRSNLR